MRRLSAVGNSGGGKTTLAKRIAAQLQVPHLELDSIFHLPGWQELSADEFRRAVADTVIWLNLPRRTVMRQVVPRTVRRLVLRTELWNGNREPWSNAWSVDPQRSILAWAWTQHREYRHRYTAAMHDPALAHLHFVVLCSRREIDAFLSGLAQSTMA